MSFNVFDIIFLWQFTISNENNPKCNFYSKILHCSQHILVCNQVSPSSASIWWPDRKLSNHLFSCNEYWLILRFSWNRVIFSANPLSPSLTLTVRGRPNVSALFSEGNFSKKKGVWRSEISWLFLIYYELSENQKNWFFIVL